MLRWIHPSRFLLLGSSLLVIGWSAIGYASSGELGLREAFERMLSSNAELAAYRHVLKAQDGRIEQAGLRPNPELTTELENAFGTGQTRTLDAAELTIGLSQLIELGGLRDKRIAAGRIEKDRLEIEGHVKRLDLIAEVARRFLSIVRLQEEHQLTHLGVELARRTADAVTRRVEAAKSPAAELDRTVVALERAQIADAHVEHLLVVARYNLAALWGAAEPDFGSVAADLYQLPAVPDYQGLLASLEDTPDLNRYLSEARLHDSEARLALASRNPGIRLGAGIRRLEEVNANAMVFSVSVPLAVFNRNQGSIAEAEALKAGAEETRAAEFIKSRNQLFGDYRELLDLRDQVTALRDRALPRMESALKNTEYAFERGRYSYLELTDAQQELLDLRGTLIDAAALYHLTRIEIERLTGAAVSP